MLTRIQCRSSLPNYLSCISLTQGCNGPAPKKCAGILPCSVVGLPFSIYKASLWPAFSLRCLSICANEIQILPKCTIIRRAFFEKRIIIFTKAKKNPNQKTYLVFLTIFVPSMYPLADSFTFPLISGSLRMASLFLS